MKMVETKSFHTRSDSDPITYKESSNAAPEIIP